MVLIHQVLGGFEVLEDSTVVIEELFNAKVIFFLMPFDMKLQIDHLVSHVHTVMIQVVGHWHHRC
jgi:hypothetical protein